MGGILPSQVQSQTVIDKMFQSDYILNIKDKKVLLEYEAPYHFIKDKYFMTGEYDMAFT